MRHVKFAAAAVMAGGLLIYFNNCSQPYQLETVQNSTFATSQSTDANLVSEKVTNDLNVQLKLNKQYAQEVYVTATADCGTGGQWQPYAEDFTFALPKTDGSYPLSVKFRNFGKIETACVPIDAVTLDQTAPTVMLPLMPPTFINKTQVAVQFASSDNLSGIKSVQCMLNGVALPTCDAINSKTLAMGAYSLAVMATDVAGNNSQTVTANWTVDVTAPTVAINAMPAAFTPATTATFNFASADVGSAVDSTVCALDANTAAACNATVTYNALTEVAHKFTVTVTDKAGNAVSQTYNWMVDFTPPTLAFVAVPAAIVNTRNVTYTFNALDGGSGLATVVCSLDGGTAANCTSPHALANLVDGSHTLKITATDKAGNASSIMNTFTVDATAPVVTYTTKPDPNVYLTSRQFSFAYTTSDAGTGIASVTCKLDNGTAAACNASGTALSGLTDGPHTFTVTATDNATNATAAASAFKVDATPPTDPAFNPQPVANKNMTFKYSSTDATSGVMKYRCALSGVSAEADCGTQVTYNNLAKGNYKFTVFAIDNAGNQSGDTTFNFNVP
jgi:hypothetical protein